MKPMKHKTKLIISLFLSAAEIYLSCYIISLIPRSSWAFFPTAVLFFLTVFFTAALAVWFCIITLVDGD